MAGTAFNYLPAKIQAGSPCGVWANLALPAAAARLTLDADGTPDSTANPSAIHLGMTREGATCDIVPTYQQFFADEFAAPVDSKVDAVSMKIAFEMVQPLDLVALQHVASGWGTYATGAGFDEIRVGLKAMAYQSMALIFEQSNNAGMFAVFNLYQAFASGGFSGLAVSRKLMSGIPITLEGTAITTRAVTDTIGNYWRETT